MIFVENLGAREDGVILYRRYSDKGVMLLQVETGIMYEDPVDVEDAPYTYEETDILIKDGEREPSLAPDEISAEEFMALIEEVL